MERRILALMLLTVIVASCGVQKKAEVSESKGVVRTGAAPSNKSADIEHISMFIDANTQKILGNHNKAKSGFERCVQDDPSNDAAWYELSILYANMLDVQNALSAAENAYNLDPDNRYYVSNLANVYSMNYRHDDAAELYSVLAEKYPEDIECQINYANFLLKTDKYEESLAQLDVLEALIGLDPDIVMKRVAIYGLMKNNKKAYLELEKMIEINPKDTKYLSMLAEMYIKDGKDSEALKCYKRIEEINPDDPYIHFTLSDYYKKMGDEESARKELVKAFAIPAMDVNTKINVLLANYPADVIFNERPMEVFDLLRTLAETHPEDGRSQALMGDFYFFDQKLGMARQYYYKAMNLWQNPSVYLNLLQIEANMENVDSVYSISARGVSLFPLSPEFYYYRGTSEVMMEKKEDAIRTLEEGLKFVVGNDGLKSSFYTNLGDCYYSLGDKSKAFSAFDNAILLNPNNVYVLNNYSYYLSTSDTLVEKAEIMGKKIVDLQPENSHYLDTYGWALFKNKKYDEAVKYLKEALKFSGGDDKQTIYEHLGDAEWMRGKKDEAAIFWQKAINVSPETASELLKKKNQDKMYYE